MIIPSIGSQLPNNFEPSDTCSLIRREFPSGGAFLLVLQIFAPKSKCGGGAGIGVKALFAPCLHILAIKGRSFQDGLL